MATDRILFETRSMELEQLIDDKIKGALVIPDHQREYCWQKPKQEKFIDSLLEGLPCPSILIGNMSGSHVLTLEDGNQRLTTAQRYKNNDFKSGPGSGRRSYNELTMKEQLMFNMYRMPVVVYRNATEEQRIRIFDWHQNGAPLTVGERYHAHSSTPLVTYVKQTLFTPGQGLHDRAAKVWGVRGGADKRRKALKNAVGFVVGLAFGSEFITQNYEKIISATLEGDDESHNLLLETFDTALTTANLEKILRIYEEVEKRAPAGSNKIWKNKLWDGGFATCHIIHAMQRLPWDTVFEKWVEFLVKCKTQPGSYESFVEDVKTKDRNWKPERWQRMFQKMFPSASDGGIAAENSGSSSNARYEESEDESDEESYVSSFEEES